MKGDSFYLVGSEMFFVLLPLSKITVVKWVKDAGFSDIKVTTLQQKQVENPVPNLTCFFFLSATKD